MNVLQKFESQVTLLKVLCNEGKDSQLEFYLHLGKKYIHLAMRY